MARERREVRNSHYSLSSPEGVKRDVNELPAVNGTGDVIKNASRSFPAVLGLRDTVLAAERLLPVRRPSEVLADKQNGFLRVDSDVYGFGRFRHRLRAFRRDRPVDSQHIPRDVRSEGRGPRVAVRDGNVPGKKEIRGEKVSKPRYVVYVSSFAGRRRRSVPHRWFRRRVVFRYEAGLHATARFVAAVRCPRASRQAVVREGR